MNNHEQTEFEKKVLDQFMSGKSLFGKDGAFAPMLKNVLEKALSAEMETHLDTTERSEGNKRNGKGKKTIKSSFGSFDIETPQDRHSTFEPEIVKKRQTILADNLADKIIGLYGLGMSYRDISSHIKELYDKNNPIIIGGDFNVIPTDDDVYSPENYKNDACAHPKTREQYRILINKGFTDTVKFFLDGKTNWTFWGYRGGSWEKGNGLRIDHFITTADVTDLIKKVSVNREPRGWEKASDHTPVTIEFIN